jgi:hypothetical protein
VLGWVSDFSDADCPAGCCAIGLPLEARKLAYATSLLRPMRTVRRDTSRFPMIGTSLPCGCIGQGPMAAIVQAPQREDARAEKLCPRAAACRRVERALGSGGSAQIPFWSGHRRSRLEEL